MKFIATLLLGGGALLAGGLPNPEVGECAIADAVVTRSEPTFIDPEGQVTGLRIWQVCGYQVPTGTGSNMRAVDDRFVVDIDLGDVDADDAETVAEVLGG